MCPQLADELGTLLRPAGDGAGEGGEPVRHPHVVGESGRDAGRTQGVGVPHAVVTQRVEVGGLDESRG